MKAKAARYGNVQPDVFDELDIDEAAEITFRVTELYFEDIELERDLHVELTKAQIKAQGVRFG